jgi:ribosomal protein S18 acetylase RimI-like enzyme
VSAAIISYTDSLDGITPGRLRGFFVGWPVDPPTSELHLRILQGSSRVILAVDDQTGNVVGFITAITDGVLTGFIPLLEVLPEYRGRGIGSELVRRMLEQLRGLRTVDLMCDPELQPFYARFGMVPSHGMVVRRSRRPLAWQPASTGGEDRGE